MVCVNFYWQLPCSSKLVLHKVCMNSSAVTLHRASFSYLNSHIFMSKYIKLHLHANTSTSIWVQSGSYINKSTLFTCEYIKLHERPHITHLQVYSWLHIFQCKHNHTQATVNHSRKWKQQKATLCSMYKARNSHIIALVLSNWTTHVNHFSSSLNLWA